MQTVEGYTTFSAVRLSLQRLHVVRSEAGIWAWEVLLLSKVLRSCREAQLTRGIYWIPVSSRGETIISSNVGRSENKEDILRTLVHHMKLLQKLVSTTANLLSCMNGYVSAGTLCIRADIHVKSQRWITTPWHFNLPLPFWMFQNSVKFKIPSIFNVLLHLS
jgi:hypothetical protein